MAVRVTADEVKAILDTTLTDAQLDVFIASANILVDDLLSGASCHTTASLKEMERWISAHFATARELELVSDKIGEAAESYGGTGKSSRYWDRASQIDCSGLLVNQGNVPFTASFIGGAG